MSRVVRAAQSAAALKAVLERRVVGQQELKSALVAICFEASLSNPGVFFHIKMRIRVVAHVDDLLMCGTS